MTASSKVENLMLILSSPSGAGKTTLSKKIQQKYKNFKISVSHTTRKARSNEINGVDYFFVNENEFKKMINENEFYEYAKIFDNYYGTSKYSIKQLLKGKFDILFDIDWQGTQQLMNNSKEDLVKVFVLPPSIGELERRLKERNQDDDEIIQKRMSKASDEMSHYAEYDYILVNDNFDKTVKAILNILNAERLKNHRQINTQRIVKKLRGSL